MDKVAYAVHTRSCTFLLDANGLCHWIVSRTGVLPTEVRGCVGAQFVACLHPELEGSLAGELVIGAAALFVKQDDESGAFALMRSGVILHVEQRGAARQSVADGVLSDDTLDLKGPPMSAVPPPPSGYPNSRGGDTMPPPPVQLPAPLEMEELDIEPDPSVPQLRPVDHESTVTLTLPLFRPDSPRRV